MSILMEKEDKGMATTKDSSAPVTFSLEDQAKGSENVGIAHVSLGQRLNTLVIVTDAEEEGTSSIQGFSKEVEVIMKDDENLVAGVKPSGVEEAVKWFVVANSDEQSKGLIGLQENATEEGILRSCVKEEPQMLDDESDATSSASASTNDSITCVYSFPLRKTAKGGKKSGSQNPNSYEAEMVDGINIIKAILDKDWEKLLAEKKRECKNHANSGSERYDFSSGIGRGRATGMPRCIPASVQEPIGHPSTPQNHGSDDDDSDDNYDDYY